MPIITSTPLHPYSVRDGEEEGSEFGVTCREGRAEFAFAEEEVYTDKIHGTRSMKLAWLLLGAIKG